METDAETDRAEQIEDAACSVGGQFGDGRAFARLAADAAVLATAARSRAARPAEDVSAPAILQMFEAVGTRSRIAWRISSKSATGRCGCRRRSGPIAATQSVGYDVFDRFDLGGPRNETLYGTETSLKANIAAAHTASVQIYTDFILNHNGFGNLGTVDTRARRARRTT